MGFEQLEQNLVDVIVEEQIKLGYRSEQIGLYFPLASLTACLAPGLSGGRDEGRTEAFQGVCK